MNALLHSLLHVVRTNLSYALEDPPDWLTWTVLTVLLATPVYLVLQILGFGWGPMRPSAYRGRARPYRGIH